MVRTEVLILGYPQILRQVHAPGARLRDLASEVLDLLMEAFSASRGEIVVLNPGVNFDAPFDEARFVQFRLHQGFTAEEYGALEAAGIPERSLRRALAERSSYIMQDTSQEGPADHAISQLLHNGSWMNHTLEMNGEVLAYIHLAHAETGQFNAQDLASLRDVSMVLALVLNICRLRERAGETA